MSKIYREIKEKRSAKKISTTKQNPKKLAKIDSETKRRTELNYSDYINERYTMLYYTNLLNFSSKPAEQFTYLHDKPHFI